MRGHTDERRPYRQTESLYATKRSPKGGNAHGDRVPVVAQRLGQRPGHDEGGQAPGLPSTGGVRMDKKAPTRLEALWRTRIVLSSLGPESRML